MDKYIQKGIEIVRNGGIIIFPTDTAFGIGCRVDDEAAVQRLFDIRKRPQEKATPVLVDTVKMTQDYLEPISQEIVDRLIEPYWPGALTIVFPCKTEKVPARVRGNGKTIGVRIPNHATARTLIRELKIPILGPSANFHGESTPFEFKDIDPQLIRLVDYVIPGECTLRQASTVVDCSVKPWRILRQGAISLSENEL